MSDKILVAGSLAFDNLYKHQGSFLDGIDTSKLDDLSISFTVTDHTIQKGGAGANIAWNLALLECPVALFCVVGKDAKEYVTILEARGVNTEHIIVYEKGATPHCVIATDNELRQITLFDSGVELQMDWLREIQNCQNIRMVLVGPWQPEFSLPIFTWAAAKNIPAIFDPGQHILDYNQTQLHKVLETCEGIVLNTYEWHILQGRANLKDTDIIEKVNFIIVTKGEDGFDVHTKKGNEHFPACQPLQTINPTGAGDAFRAGLLSGLYNNDSLEDACKLGAALASKVVEQEGALLDNVDITELNARKKL